jgi:hypothetical protein
MATLIMKLPESLWQRMQALRDEDWTLLAVRAFEARIAEVDREDSSNVIEAAANRLRAGKNEEGQADRIGYDRGYSWARDRAKYRDLQAMIDAPSYASAAQVVRNTSGFCERDEFGDALRPSDEMWEAFVDGATQLYRDIDGRT